MARQGLMDDCGYQGFEECSRYEECFKEAYEKGYAEAIDGCTQIVKDYSSALVGTYYYNLFIDKMEKLKERNNWNKSD